MANIIQPDGGTALMAILRRRPIWNCQKMAPNSYPNCCQITFSTELEESEVQQEGKGAHDPFMDALLHSAVDNFNLDFTRRHFFSNSFIKLLDNDPADPQAIPLCRVKIWGVMIRADDLKTLKMNIDPVTEAMMKSAVVISPDMRIHGPKDNHVRAFFLEEIQAVKKALDLFKNNGQ